MTEILNLDIEETLSKSVTFTMSRGGRELFHTNFIAFILESDSVQLQLIKQNIIRLLFEGCAEVPTKVIALREKSNLDLIIIPYNETFNPPKDIVIIEAKLKALPSIQQLESYNKKLERLTIIDGCSKSEVSENAIDKMAIKTDSDGKLQLTTSHKDKSTKTTIKLHKFLLAPKSMMSKGKVEQVDWKVLEWEKLLENIKTGLGEINSDSDLLIQVVNDYVHSTKSLLALVESTINFSAKFINNDINFEKFYKEIQKSQLIRKLRLHDLVGKVAYDNLLNRLVNNIEFKEVSGFKLQSRTFYSRATPGIMIYFEKTFDGNRIEVGIQIQGNDYRHFFSQSSAGKLHLASLIKTNLYKWMTAQNNKGKRQKIDSSSEEFKVYDKDKFVYLSHPLDNVMEFNALEDAVVRSLNQLDEMLNQDDDITDKLINRN